MVYNPPRYEKIHTWTTYSPLRRTKQLTMTEYVIEKTWYTHYGVEKDEDGKWLYIYDYCLTIPELRWGYKKRVNKSYRRGSWKCEVRNYHKSHRAKRKQKLKKLDDNIEQKWIWREW